MVSGSGLLVTQHITLVRPEAENQENTSRQHYCIGKMRGCRDPSCFHRHVWSIVKFLVLKDEFGILIRRLCPSCSTARTKCSVLH